MNKGEEEGVSEMMEDKKVTRVVLSVKMDLRVFILLDAVAERSSREGVSLGDVPARAFLYTEKRKENRRQDNEAHAP